MFSIIMLWIETITSQLANVYNSMFSIWYYQERLDCAHQFRIRQDLSKFGVYADLERVLPKKAQ